jgi:hypothetical protein
MFVEIVLISVVGLLVVSVAGLATFRAARRREVLRRDVTWLVATQLEGVPAAPETSAPEPAIALRDNEELGVLDKLPPFGPVVIRLPICANSGTSNCLRWCDLWSPIR